MKQLRSIQTSLAQLLHGNGENSRPTSPIEKEGNLPKRLVYLNVNPPVDKFDRKGRIVYTYPSNKIHSAKYNLFTFIPKNLFEQFRRLANFYFLALVVLQSIPDLEGSTSPFLAAFPIFVIVSITAIKDAFEDFKRHRSDHEINGSTCHVARTVLNVNHSGHDMSYWKHLWLSTQFFFKDTAASIRKLVARGPRTHDYEQQVPMEEVVPQSPTRNINIADAWPSQLPSTDVLCDWDKIMWQDLKVGDIVYLKNNDNIPADIVVLSSSEPDSICYVETKNLDGETNLKIRNGFAETSWLQKPQDAGMIRCVFESEAPNVNLYTFNGALHIPQNGNAGLSKSLSNNQLDIKRTTKTISMEQSTKKTVIPISANELLLRGCVVRNTEWVIGVVLYTGRETKLIMNSGQTPSKRSEIEKRTNNQVLANFILLIILCLIIAIGHGVSYSYSLTGSAPYIISNYEIVTQQTSAAEAGFQAFCLILLQNLVPISLYVTTELVKSFQAFFIYSDLELYYEPFDAPCVPKTWTIADDLGQIEYLFSDKTGTLTRNIMEFRKCSIGGVVYGGYHTNTEEAFNFATPLSKGPSSSYKGKGKAPVDIGTIASSENVMVNRINTYYKNPYLSEEITFVDNNFVEDLFDEGSNQSLLIREFFTLLAVCHTVLAEYPDPENDFKIVYQAQSPDEAALVSTARDCGFVFVDRDQDSATVTVLGNELKFKVLNIIEFTSTRKRMSVIVKSPNGTLLLYTKGADSVIYERLAPDQGPMQEVTFKHLENFAGEGLRTLCLAYRVLSETEYKDWSAEYQNAATSMTDREILMDKCAAKLETSLILLGATAIEDQLQEGVPDCIARLAQAGIKVWVLTGDKLETAINIGFSCQLLDKEMVLIIIKGIDASSTRSQLIEALNRCFDTSDQKILELSGGEEDVPLTGNNANTSTHDILDGNVTGDGPRIYSLVIDGHSLRYALNSHNYKLFVELSCLCKAVVCCRVSPLQKAQVVDVIKKEKKAITLAIGDGANDVSMIQAANVGVGILGQEGRQAVMASDYAIAQFRYLKRLLLVHGRWSYFRTAELTLLMFYKNIIWAMIPFWYQIFCGWSAQLPYNYFFIMTYNLIFTALPPIIIGVLDQDLFADISLAVPGVYIHGIKRELFTLRIFFIYIADGLYQSLVCFFLAYWSQGEVQTKLIGLSANWLHFGSLAAAMAIVNCNAYMAFQAYHWTWLHFVAFFGSPVVFFVVTIIYSIIEETMYGVPAELLSSVSFWLALLLSFIMCNLPRYLITFIDAYLNPGDIDIVREIVKYKLDDEWKKAISHFEQDEEVLLESDVGSSPTGGPPIQVISPSPKAEADVKSPREGGRPPSPLEKINTEFNRWVSSPIKRRLSQISPTVNKASSMLFMRTGTSAANTGYAFSQEPGMATHIRNISSALSMNSEKRRRRRNASYGGDNLGLKVQTVDRDGSSSKSQAQKQHGMNRWSIAGNMFGPVVPQSPVLPMHPPSSPIEEVDSPPGEAKKDDPKKTS